MSRAYSPGSHLVKAAIFDIDGTLIDSVDHHARAWQEAFREFGREIPYNDIRMQIGKGADRLVPSLLREHEAKRIGEAIDRRRGEIFQHEYLPKVQPFACVRELFLRLRQNGIRIVLGSSANGDELTAYKRIAAIGDLVEDETSSDDADRSKPSPDIFQAALDKLHGIDAEHAIVVGDTPYDAQAARKIGLRVIGVLCGGFPEADLIRAGCEITYKDPADLLAHLDRSPFAMPQRRVA